MIRDALKFMGNLGPDNGQGGGQTQNTASVIFSGVDLSCWPVEINSVIIGNR